MTKELISLYFNSMLNVTIIKSWIAKFFNLQIFITLIALPIQLYWGLPLSIVSPISNLFFLPFLMVFLFFSSLLFFCTLCNIPNGILIQIIEQITIWWQWIMQQGSSWWLIGCPKPSLFLIILILVISFVILHHKKYGNNFLNGCLLLGLLSITIFCLKYFNNNELRVLDVPCHKGSVKIISNKEVIIIDSGYIGSKISAEKWINYTLIPTLIQHYGSTTIDHFILLQPSIITFNALARNNSLIIKNMYIVVWDGTLKALNYSFMQLCTKIKNQHGSIVRIGKQTRDIISDQIIISMEPINKQLQYKEISFPATKIVVNHRNTIIEQLWPKSMPPDII